MCMRYLEIHSKRNKLIKDRNNSAIERIIYKSELV